MQLIIETYWNKLEPVPEYEKALYGSFVNKPIRGRYEMKSEKEWRQSVKKQHRFVEFDDKGRAKLDCGSAYGIHSYQLVYLQDY